VNIQRGNVKDEQPDAKDHPRHVSHRYLICATPRDRDMHLDTEINDPTLKEPEGKLRPSLRE
jgi:hypothetical protein